MTPRRRRGLLFMLLSVLVAFGVFAVVSSYVQEVNSRVGPLVTVYQAQESLDAYTALSSDNVEAVEIPERYVSESALRSASEVDGRVIAVPVGAGSPLTRDLLVPPSELDPTEREVAVNVNAVTGLAGRVRPGDRVDVYTVYRDVEGLPDQARVLLRGVRVVSVSGQVQVTGPEQTLRDVIPVTLALVPEQALAITYANSFATEVRLVGLPPGLAEDRSEETDQFDVEDLGGLIPSEEEEQ